MIINVINYVYLLFSMLCCCCGTCLCCGITCCVLCGDIN